MIITLDLYVSCLFIALSWWVGTRTREEHVARVAGWMFLLGLAVLVLTIVYELLIHLYKWPS